jgi:hypothetical protein
VWKDTVLVRTGQVVDILFDVTNPGARDRSVREALRNHGKRFPLTLGEFGGRILHERSAHLAGT